jgi:hypothetical protein
MRELKRNASGPFSSHTDLDTSDLDCVTVLRDGRNVGTSDIAEGPKMP